MSSSAPTWLVTAASSGFGKFIALEALSRGHTVLATARNPTKIDDLKSKGAKTYALDVTWEMPRIQSTVDQMVKDAGGRVDILINAAGYVLEGALEETSYVFFFLPLPFFFLPISKPDPIPFPPP